MTTRLSFLFCSLLLCAPLFAEQEKKIVRIGVIEYKACSESSGVVASRRHAGVFWTHCDSGNDPSIYAMTREGKFLAEYRVNEKNDDWEDIAIDDAGNLYIADIGNNGSKKNQVEVHRLPEPDPAKNQQGVAKIKSTKTWKIAYPQNVGPFDAEGFFVFKDHGYIVSKHFAGQPATIYRFPLNEKNNVTLERVVALPVNSPATAASISPDGNRIAILSLGGLTVLDIKGDITNAGKVAPISISFIHPSTEGVTFAPDGVIVTAESREIYLFTLPQPAAPAPAPAPAPPAGEAPAPQGANHQAPLAPHLAIRQLAKPIAIDANLDDWDTKTTELLIRSAHREDPTQKPKSARAFSAWTDKGIYLAAIIPADNLAPLEETWYGGDAVEVFIGPHSADRSTDWAEGDDRCYLGFGKTPAGKLGDFQIHWPRRQGNQGPVGAQAAGALNKDGTYQFELFLPAAILGESTAKSGLKAGDQLRFNLSILAKRPRRNWYFGTSNAEGCWMTPMNWAIITLEK